MTAPFSAQGHGELAVDERRRGQLRDELGERPPDRREQLEQLAEARDRVVGRQELREDVAASDGAGEDDAVLGRGLRQIGERGGRPDDLEPTALEQPVDLARDGDREGELARACRSCRAGGGTAAALWSTGTSRPCSSTR